MLHVIENSPFVSTHNNSANSSQVSVLCSVLSYRDERHSGLQKPPPHLRVRSLPHGPQDNGGFSNGLSGEQREKRMHPSPASHSHRLQGISVPRHRPFSFQPSISVYIKTYMRDWGLRLPRKCMHIYFAPNRTGELNETKQAGVPDALYHEPQKCETIPQPTNADK